MLRRSTIEVPAPGENLFQRPLNSVDRLLDEPAGPGIADLVPVESHHLQRIAHVVIHLCDLLQPLLEKTVLFLSADLALQKEHSRHQAGQGIAEEKDIQPRYAFPEQQAVEAKPNTAHKYGEKEESESEPQFRFHVLK